MADKKKRKDIVVPIPIVAVGVGWPLNALHAIPDVNWIWTIGLAAIGLLTLIGGGLNKVSVVIGPWFIVASVLSVLRQTGQLSENVEVPCLVILLGVLLLVSHLSNLPAPDSITED